ncbi:hypothetical protein [Histidinibacterium lentulum]|nr:hypothetical protein [Histidinibacterium lentulum]
MPAFLNTIRKSLADWLGDLADAVLPPRAPQRRPVPVPVRPRSPK